ncbi:MAG: TrkH family potassium uptake protein [Bacteroidaceae bacterium]|nr:TrkH family potassium uptake protein [Bacteroidaceae bacterium]MBQ8888323.1 TrkH family potassium uptake protein [Bacteroidaceae bacterium]
MINWKMIAKIMGFLLFIEAGFLTLCTVLSAFYQEPDLPAFIISTLITAVIGIPLTYVGKKAERKLSRRDGYVVVTFAWIIFSLFGMLPYYISGYIPNITNAFFETMSGFTTTGASILNDIEALPHALLFWRSMTQWIGGMGIVIFTIAVLPIFGVGGIQLFAAEATGPTFDKVTPRIDVTAKWIWTIYLGLTIAQTVLLMAGDMPLFDSVCHAMTTTATGGFSTKQASIAAFHSPYIEYVVTVFMFLSGINFSLLYLLFLKGSFKRVFGDTEIRWYVKTILFFTLVITVGLLLTSSMELEEAFRRASFLVVSLQTTCGFITADYMQWAPPLWMLTTVITYCGACAGSTTGGVKCIRAVIMARIAKNEFKHILHPNAVLPVRINRLNISSTTKSTVLAFFVVFVILVFLGWFLMMIFGLGFADAYSVVISSLANVGPGIGMCGPAFSWDALPDAAKWLSTIYMLIGRLELFTVLLLLTPAFWKKH